MTYEEINWHCDGHDMTIGMDHLGAGPTLLLLPALSSISTRREVHSLQQRLADSFTTISIDWPGFGELSKPYINWRPELYQAYLSHLLENVFPAPFGIIAAGHATGYVLKYFAQHNQAVERLVLLSPTWRGPLPTMMNGKHEQFPRIAKAVDLPLVGPLLYRLNVNRVVVGLMARGHVYADPDWLSSDRMQAKLEVTRTPGARHGSARFVAGCLDPFKSRCEQIEAAQRITLPMLNLFSENAPRKSRAEMEALAELPNVITERMPQGKLSFYEEFPGEASQKIHEFLTDPSAGKNN